MIVVGVIMFIAGMIWSETLGGWGLIFIVGGIVRRFLAKARQPDVFEKLAEYEVIPCGIVIANSQALQTPGSKAPAALVGGFQYEHPGYAEVISAVAKEVGAVYGSSPEAVAPELREVCELINDDTYREGRRRPVPPTLSQGFELFFFDGILNSSFFQSNQIDFPIVFVAVSRASGSIFHVPFELVVWESE